jgi:hypothetical protein
LAVLSISSIPRDHPRLTGGIVGFFSALPIGIVMTMVVSLQWQVNFYGSIFIMAPIAAAIAGAVTARRVHDSRLAAWAGMALMTVACGVLIWPIVAVVAPFWTGQLSCFTIYNTAIACGSSSGLSTWQIVGDGMGQFVNWFPIAPLSALIVIPYLPAIAIEAGIWTVLLRRLLRPPSVAALP